MTVNPMVSVRVITYNHESFIRQCLDSILSQKTNFPFEILIGEDESSDQTREICIQYAEKYPKLIKLFLRSRSDVIYRKGLPTNKFNFRETFKAATGKYIAICDGDDYWTDDYKLQKQVEFLEANQDFAICHHHGYKLIERENKKQFVPFKKQSEVSNLGDLLKDNFIVNCTVMYKAGLVRDFPQWFYESPVGDFPLHILHAMHGKIGYLEDSMSVYRKHSGGIWTGDKSIRRVNEVIEFFELLKSEVLPSKWHKSLNRFIYLYHYRAACIHERNTEEFIDHFNYLKKNFAFHSSKINKIINVYLKYYLGYTLKKNILSRLND